MNTLKKHHLVDEWKVLLFHIQDLSNSNAQTSAWKTGYPDQVVLFSTVHQTNARWWQ
jgi:hypothetical protein